MELSIPGLRHLMILLNFILKYHKNASFRDHFLVVVKGIECEFNTKLEVSFLKKVA